jgi:hypothetical protein
VRCGQEAAQMLAQTRFVPHASTNNRPAGSISTVCRLARTGRAAVVGRSYELPRGGPPRSRVWEARRQVGADELERVAGPCTGGVVARAAPTGTSPRSPDGERLGQRRPFAAARRSRKARWVWRAELICCRSPRRVGHRIRALLVTHSKVLISGGGQHCRSA